MEDYRENRIYYDYECDAGDYRSRDSTPNSRALPAVNPIEASRCCNHHTKEYAFYLAAEQVIQTHSLKGLSDVLVCGHIKHQNAY